MISDYMRRSVAGGSAIRAMFEEGNKLASIHGRENIYDFTLGNPSVAPPEAIKNAILSIIGDEAAGSVHGYMNNSGFEDVRRKIAENLNKDFGTDYDPSGIILTCGAAGALNIVFRTLLNPGDEVIVFTPYFAEYNSYVGNFGGRIVRVPTDPATFTPEAGALEQSITPDTKAVLINSPNNPTGAVYSEETIKNIAAVLEDYRKKTGRTIYLVSDEPYRKLVYGGANVPYPPLYYHDTLVAYSFSKSLSIPGERIGYLAVPSGIDGYEEMTAALGVANRILGFVNAPSLFQRVAALCVDTAVDVSPYEKNINLLYENLTEMGYEFTKPDGAFYIFPKAPGGDDKAFCEAAKQHRLLVVPGTTFGMSGYFRIACCVPYETCVNALESFKKTISMYK